MMFERKNKLFLSEILIPEHLPVLSVGLRHVELVRDAGEVLPHQHPQPVCPVIPSPASTCEKNIN